MTISAVPLASGVGTGASVQVISVATNTTVVVKRTTINNTTVGAITFTAIANDPTPREVISAKPLATLKSDQCPELVGLTLRAGQSLNLNLPVGVTYWISGIIVI